MSGIVIKSASLPDSTIISNDFIDHIMPSANGEFVKVYIYLLRCFAANQEISINSIADLFEHTEKDVLRAFKYWEKNNLLAIEYDDAKNVVGLEILGGTGRASAVTVPSASSQASSEVSSDSSVEAPKAKKSSAKGSKANADSSSYVQKVSEATEGSLITPPASLIPEKQEYTLDEIKEFQKNDSVSELLFIIETYMRHPLSSGDTNSILFWYDKLGFNTELIIYLVEYCITKGHSSIRYMEKVAIAWKEQNITSVAEAKGNAEAHSKAYYAVMKAFGINGRNLVESEMNYIKKWTKEYSFDLDIIQEACKRTITNTHQPSFEYADKILNDWFTKKVHTLKDIEKIDSSFDRNKRQKPSATVMTPKNNRFNNFDQRKYDADQLEKLLLTTSIHQEWSSIC